MENCGPIKFFKLFVKDTIEKDLVIERTLFLCTLTRKVKMVLNTDSVKVYWNSVSVKHLYDKRPAQEFDYILRNIIQIVKYPDRIYTNLSGKKGGYLFFKKLKEGEYLCSIEVLESGLDEGSSETNFIVTAFKNRKENYLKKYDLLWSWKGDIPPS